MPEKREEFLQSISLLKNQLVKSQRIKGITLYQDVDNPTRFSLLEEFHTQDELDEHTRSEIFRTLMGALKVLSEHSEIRYKMRTENLGVSGKKEFSFNLLTLKEDLMERG